MQSVGIGAFNPPNNSAILSAVANEEHAVISGFLNLVRNSASVISVAIATAVVTMTMGSMGYPPSLAEVSAEGSAGLLDAFVTGLRYAYWLMAAMLAVGVAFTFAGTPVLQSGESGCRIASRVTLQSRLSRDTRYSMGIRAREIASGVAMPPENTSFIASSTDMSVSNRSSSATRAMLPDVGFGAVGM